MNRTYISEFSVFMNHYLEDHPEVVAEQRRGWEFFWNPKADLEAMDKEPEDIAPDDAYGYSWSAWRAESPEVKVH
jgi:hypothetical protein